MEGRQQPTLEELLNTIALQRKALEFYSNSKNYTDKNSRTINSFSTMEKDMGHQARFALEQSKNIENYNKTLIEDLNKIIDEKNEQDEQDEEALNIISKINKLILNVGK